MFRLSVFSLFFLCAVNVKSWLFTDVDMRDMMRMADELYEDDYVDDYEDEITLKLSLIYPGTKWCGAGDVADNYDDLGSERETDMCCRAHDNCPDVMQSGESKHNLTNDAYYVRLSCQCDETFRKCLRAVQQNTKSKSARNIGHIYFNGLHTQCFRDDYPVVKCIKKGGWFSEKCLEYEYDTSLRKRYQWFDVRNF